MAAAAWRHRGALHRFASPDRLADVLPDRSGAKRWARALLVLIALTLILVALADPRQGERNRDVPPSDTVSVVFALDVSRSMLAQDVSPNRLDRSKQYIRDFIAALASQEDDASVGLVAFAGGVKRVAPVTRNAREFELALQATDPTTVPRGGSNLAQAVEIAARSFVDRRPGHKVVVMLTDGENLSGEPIDAARAAFESRGVRFFPVGLGDPNTGSPLPAGPGQVVMHAGKPVESKLDADVLKKLAQAGGGLYVPAETKRADMAELYRRVIRPRLNATEDRDAAASGASGASRTSGASATVKTMIPRFGRLAWPALVLLLIERLLAGGLFTRVKSRGVAMAVVAIAMAWPAGAQTPMSVMPAEDPLAIYNAAVAAYDAGDTQAATQGFTQAALRGRGAVEARSRYNLGRVSHEAAIEALESDSKSAQDMLDVALREYAAALAVDPSFADARANLEAAARLREQLKEQASQEEEQEEEEQDPKSQDGEDGEEGEDDQAQKEDQKSGEQEGQEGQDGKPNESQDQESQDNASDEQEEGSESESDSENQEDATAGSDSPEAQETPESPETSDDEGEDPAQEQTDAPKEDSGNNSENAEPSSEPQEGQALTLTPEEAQKLLQRIRDQDLKRRIEQYRRAAREQERVEKDW